MERKQERIGTVRKGRRNKGCIVMATAFLAALLGGCSFLSKEADATEVSSEAETESPGAHTGVGD